MMGILQDMAEHFAITGGKVHDWMGCFEVALGQTHQPFEFFKRRSLQSFYLSNSHFDIFPIFEHLNH